MLIGLAIGLAVGGLLVAVVRRRGIDGARIAALVHAGAVIVLGASACVAALYAASGSALAAAVGVFGLAGVAYLGGRARAEGSGRRLIVVAVGCAVAALAVAPLSGAVAAVLATVTAAAVAVRWSAAITQRIWRDQFEAEGELTDTEYTALRIAGIRLRQLGWPSAVTDALEVAGKGYEERELARLRGDLHRWSSESLFPSAE